MPEGSGQKGPVIKGPDGEYYRFPAEAKPEQIQAYLKMKQPKAAAAPAAPQAQPQKDISGSSAANPPKSGLRSTGDYIRDQLPNVGGIVGDIAAKGGGPVGAAMGWAGAEVLGAAGDAAKTGIKVLEGEQDRPHGFDIIHHAAEEGMKQGALALGGRALGAGAAKAVEAIPKMTITKGIPRMPWEVNAGKVGQYFGALTENLFGSAGKMAKTREFQTGEILKAGEKLANSMSRFKGTSEEMGDMVQNTLSQAKLAAFKALGKTPTPAEIQAFSDTFQTGVMKRILSKEARTNTAEIAGWLRGGNLEGLRNMVNILEERRPAALNAARTQILKDVLISSLKKGKDPLFQGTTDRFIGKEFVGALNKIERSRLEILYKPEQLKAIDEFAKLTQHVNGGTGAMFGRFINWASVGGVITGHPGNAITLHYLINIYGRMITSKTGVEAISGLERAIGAHSPQLYHAAQTAYKTAAEHAMMEENAEQEQLKDTEEESKQKYLREHN